MKQSLKIIFLSLFISTFISCSKEVNIPQDLEIHDFVWKGLNAYYLWQNDIPDLQDRRFGNQEQLNSFLQGYPTPEILFEDLLFRPTDRFSWIVDDYIALENSFQGINVSNGMEFGLVRYENNPDNLYGYVRYVVPNSDASDKNITRGMLFNSINDTKLNVNNYQGLLFGDNISYTIEFADFNNGNPTLNGNSLTLTKTEIPENPIAISKIITEGTQKIGYLLYNQFARNYDSQLNAVFANFKAENIGELIVDLRYNPGGSVSTATYFGGMITGQFNGELYSQQVWNEKVTKARSTSEFINNFTDKIEKANGTENINSLGLNKVYFIVTNASASASELVINSLSSYIDVRVIGKTTRGKQVGSITLYDSENYQRNGLNLNPNHRYAMQPLTFEISNKNNKNYPNGIIPASSDFPGIELGENYGNLGVLGERSDPLLSRTLLYISTGAKTFRNQNNHLTFDEIYNSKLATPAKDNMFVDTLN